MGGIERRQLVDTPRLARVTDTRLDISDQTSSNVLVLPTGDRSSASYWQALAGIRFTLAFPATPFVPPALAADPIVARLADDVLPQLEGANLGGTAAADAEGTADAINAQRQAAVAFTEWRAPHLLLRVASYVHSQWRVATLERRTSPIWSPRVVVTSNGTTVAAWIDRDNPVRRLLVATRTPNDGWTAPRTLDAADGLYSVGLAAGRGNRVVIAWHDSIANDERVRATVYDGGSWTRPTTLVSGTERLDHVVVGGQAAFVGWRTHRGAPGTIEFIQDARNGSSLGRPTEARRRYHRP